MEVERREGAKCDLSILQEWSVFTMLLTSRKPLDLVFGLFSGGVGNFDVAVSVESRAHKREGQHVWQLYRKCWVRRK